MWIVKNSRPACVLVKPRCQGAIIAQAFRDLRRIIYAASGARLPLARTCRETAAFGAIRLEIDPGLARGKGHLPPHDIFRIRCQGNSLAIIGAHERALAYGIYEFLESATGVRWFFPGPLGEDIPENRNILIKDGDRVCRPAFAWRAIGNGEIPGWTLNHKLADFPVTGGHAYHEIVPKTLFKKHPEFFSLIYGKRRAQPSQICHSAKGLVDRAMEYIEEQVRQKPGAAAISFCPSDFGFFCECRACRAQDDVTRHYDYYVNEPPYGYGGPITPAHLSERVFRFTNRVAEVFARTYPDKYLACFAYGAYRFPPAGLKIRDNVIVWLTHTCVGMFNPERRDAEIAMIRAWRKAARHVVIFEALANQCWPCLPREVSALVADSLKILERSGVEGYYTQMWGDFSQNLPSYYTAARLAWNPRRDRNAELRELYRRAFGPAAPWIARYYGAFEEAWRAKTGDGGMPWARSVIATHRQYGICSLVFTRPVMAAARAALEKAAQAAGTGIYRRRVAFVQAGLRHTELMMAATRECMAIEDMSIPLLYPAPWLRPPYPYEYVKTLLLGQCDRRIVAHACRRALAAFDKVADHARKYAGQYVLGPDIVRHCESREVRSILRNISKLSEAKKPDPRLERGMFVTHEL